jgi:ribosomal protein S18 acetylase RimI-like enzyme
LQIVAYVDDVPSGFLVGYDHWGDKTFYVWMAGVIPKYRHQGVLKELMNYQTDWSRFRGYHKLRIKTRNNRREMLGYLIKNDFNFVEVEPQPDVMDNRILLEKVIY